MKFSVKVDAFDKSIRLPQLTNKQYIDIVKFCENKDVEGFCSYFDDWLDISNLNCIEKFYVLIAMRIIFIDQSIQCVNGLDQVLQYDLNNILLTLDNVDNTYPDRLFYDSGDSVELDLPLSLNPPDIISSCVRSNTLGYIPVQSIQSYLDRVDGKYKSVLFLAGYEDFIKEPIQLSIQTGILAVLLMEIYKTPLDQFYQTQYHFLNKVSNSYDHYLSLTPGETNLLIKIYQEEIERQNKELNKTTI
jgi:hypothetical protein